MLFLDVNICLHAYRPGMSEVGPSIREWLTSALAGHEPVGVCESVLASMVRIATHPRIFAVPAAPDHAVAFAQHVLTAPASVAVRPGPRHWHHFSELVRTHRLRGNDVPDAYLAAIALEHGASMVSTDQGFRRFEGLRLVNPLR